MVVQNSFDLEKFPSKQEFHRTSIYAPYVHAILIHASMGYAHYTILYLHFFWQQVFILLLSKYYLIIFINLQN